MEQPQQERELREWLDRLAIQDLINRYCDAVTRADWDQCEAVFAPDAVWESPLGPRFESRAAFLEGMRRTTSNDLFIQTPHSSVITLTGPDRATATTTLHELFRGVVPADSKLGEAGAEINIDQYGGPVGKSLPTWRATVFASARANPPETRGSEVPSRGRATRAALGVPPAQPVCCGAECGP
ncbi:MAG: nuclear transport factor 2 family protein [Mycobacterium sp.]|nr:nuclear transport factor 2 family protein [Mycobacterium sp.]MBV8291399.1 nuclear transport factor 2 family protein [Mycobacterium sp.]